MQVDINITRMELVQMNLFLWPRIKWNWVQLGVTFLLCIAAMLFSDIRNFEISAQSAVLMAIIAVVISIMVAALVFSLCLAINLAMASPRTGLGEHHYEIQDGGLLETTELNEELSKWKTFDRVWKSDNYIILKRHWAALHIFPRRCFSSSQHFDEFHAAIADRISGKPEH